MYFEEKSAGLTLNKDQPWGGGAYMEPLTTTEEADQSLFSSLCCYHLTPNEEDTTSRSETRRGKWSLQGNSVEKAVCH